MKKVSFSFVFSFLFVVLFIFPAKQGNTLVGDEVSKNVEYQSGYSDGYRDAMDGVESLCASKKCKAQDPYERGYKLGYKKGIRDRKKKFPKASDEEFIRPLIDSPGNTIGSDFNGDGIHDFIVGAYQNDDAANLAGSAYIFFGSTSLSGTFDLSGGVQSPDVTILGKAGGDRLGRSVSSVGDVNGDGFDDIIVGAHQNADAAATAGAAYIFFGAGNLSGTKSLGGGESADVTILGKAGVDRLGDAVSGVGDVNGDGFDDVIVGAYFNDDGPGTGAGAAYIFFGASDLSGTKSLGEGQSADVTILGKVANDNLGDVVSGVGDVNGDGFDDIIVGAPLNDDGPGTGAGAAYIFFGASDLSGTKSLGEGQSADITILGKADSDNLGGAVSGAGDVNGDGFDDIIVGAHLNDDGPGNSAGAAYIFFGASNLSGTKSLGEGQSADTTILGKADSDNLGRSVSVAGDVNADGISDVIMGAHNNNDGGSNDEGAAYIFFGASNLSGTKSLGGAESADVTILGKVAIDRLGRSVSGLGDVNVDGFPDFIVGAPYNDDNGAVAGAVYVFFGSTILSGTKDTGSSDQDVSIIGKAGGDALGFGVGGGRSNPGP